MIWFRPSWETKQKRKTVTGWDNLTFGNSARNCHYSAERDSVENEFMVPSRYLHTFSQTLTIDEKSFIDGGWICDIYAGSCGHYGFLLMEKENLNQEQEIGTSTRNE